MNKFDSDARLLMWDMRRTVDPEIFPSARIVVQFEYPDAPKDARNRWLVSENGEIDLCLSDPGYDVDVVIKAALKTMTEVWTCQRRFSGAVKKGDIKVMGDSKLTNKLQDWLRSSPVSRLGSLKEPPMLTWNLG